MSGTKHDQDKVRMELVPGVAVRALAEVLTFGAKKYAPWNWAKGFDWSRLYGAAQRHLNAWWDGEGRDPETGLSHLAHALCCVMFLVVHERGGLGKDDRYLWTSGEEKNDIQICPHGWMSNICSYCSEKNDG